jgi:steroid 5-alpha reductase family enzyme
MKIIQTAVLLIITLLVVPVFTYFFGTPLGPDEKEALHAVIILTAIAAAYCFVLGETTGNVSQVDKLWSLLPIAYAWTITHHGDYSERLVLMAMLVTAWGLRLTYNFSRHGAYKLKFWTGTEDYRWEVLRKKPEFQPKWKWTLFNLFFISGYQNVLILLFTLPMIVAMQYSSTPLNFTDYAVAAVFLGFLVFETIADQQQWNFQTKKYAMINAGQKPTGDYAKGFLDKGLWSLSRHPNYFAEQSIWITFYFFSVITSGQWLNWTVAGCLLLVILFQGSANFSEEISARKYPLYANYQKRVQKFIPFGRKG